MDITELLAFSAKNGASDLHLSAGLPPMIRVDGEVRRINLPAMEHKDVHIRVRLVPKAKRSISQKELVNVLRERLSNMNGVEISSVAAAKESIGGGLKPIQISLQGQDLVQLRAIAAEYQEKVSKVEGVADLESSLKSARPAYAIKVDRERAADAGLSVSQIGIALRPLLAGDAVTTWQDPQGENYDVRVQLAESQRHDSDDIWGLRQALGIEIFLST